MQSPCSGCVVARYNDLFLRLGLERGWQGEDVWEVPVAQPLLESASFLIGIFIYSD
jgi:hypothetical protein